MGLKGILGDIFHKLMTHSNASDLRRVAAKLRNKDANSTGLDDWLARRFDNLADVMDGVADLTDEDLPEK